MLQISILLPLIIIIKVKLISYIFNELFEEKY